MLHPWDIQGAWSHFTNLRISEFASCMVKKTAKKIEFW